MYRIELAKRSLFKVLVVLLLVGLTGCETCSSQKKSKKTQNLKTYSLVYGGDVTFARRVNYALFSKKARSALFGDVKPLLMNAKLAVVNGEGVISHGGWFADKNERMPYMYRAHPRMVEVLVENGIDIVTVGNNHSGDYGPAAFLEMLDRLTMAGIEYTGGGRNLADARIPAYRTVGDVVVAVVGANLTVPERFGASGDSPGTLYFRDDNQKDHIVPILRELKAILVEARKHAHVVLFTPHWGYNWKTEPTKFIRKLARELIRVGYDGIMGHSAHLIHGVELIDGKPVMYDAGNLLLDYGGGDDAHRDVLFELEISRAGVERIKGYPLWLERNRTDLAKGKIRDEILKTLKRRSDDLDTELVIEGGVAKLECYPGEINGPEGTPTPPKRKKPQEILVAPSDRILNELPEGVTRVNVEYDEGIRLAGFRMLLDELKAPLGEQVVALYWTTDREVKKSYRIELQAQGLDPESGKPHRVYAGHLPGDWLLPTNEWPVGKVIQDWTLFRLKLKPQGKVDFYAGLFRKRVLVPMSADVPLFEGKLVHIGDAVYKKEARNTFKVIRERLGDRDKHGMPIKPNH